MSDVIITVRGEYELRVAPERATVRLSVGFDGPDRSKTIDQTLTVGTTVRESIEECKAIGNVTEWTSQRMNVYADRPWSNEGRQLDPVYRASIDFTATFSDISAMSEWVTDLTLFDGVSIGEVDWHLTPATAAEVEREVATQAVSIAVTRARAYAEALGLSHITPLEIADRGLIAATGSAQPKLALISRDAMSMDAATGAEFRGEEIIISATVEGRFAAN